MRIAVKSFLAFFTIGSFFGAANAAIISVNLQGNDEMGLAAGDSVGVVAAANWNNVAGVSGGPVVLNDSTGIDLPVTLSSYGVTGQSSAVGLGSTHDTPQKALFQSGLSSNWGNVTFTLTGLSAFQTYDLIVYYDAGSSFPEVRTGKISDTGLSATTYYVAGSNTARTTYILSNSTDSSVKAHGNYVQFSGLTDATQTVTYTYGENPVSVVGFQIVGTVPEPASIGLLLVMGGAVLVRRRPRSC